MNLNSYSYLQSKAAEIASSIFSSQTGKEVHARIVESWPGTESASLWFEQRTQAPQSGSLVWGVSKKEWLLFAGLLLKKAEGLPSAPEDEKERASGPDQSLKEILSKIAEHWAEQFKVNLIWVTPQKKMQRPPAVEGNLRFIIELQTADQSSFFLEVTCSPEVATLFLCEDTDLKPCGQDSVLKCSLEAKNLELLLDVELPISISFGRAQLALKDAIKLTTGSIVELNRSVSEPVEIIVNNCVIAKGEIVAVEGNLGVRIKQIISRQERLRTVS